MSYSEYAPQPVGTDVGGVVSVVADAGMTLRLSRAAALGRWRSPAGLGFLVVIPLILMGRRIFEVFSAARRSDSWVVDLVGVYCGLLAITVVIAVLVTAVQMVVRSRRVGAYAAPGVVMSVRYLRDSMEIGLVNGNTVIAYGQIRDLFVIGGAVFVRRRGAHGIALPRELFPEAGLRLMGRSLDEVGGRRNIVIGCVAVVSVFMAAALAFGMKAFVYDGRPTVPELRGTIPLENPADAMTVYGDTAYVACWDDNVRIIDIPTRTVTAVIPVGPGAHDIEFDPRSRQLYVPNGESGGDNSRVSVIDTEMKTVSATIPFAKGVWMMAVDSVAQRIYVVGRGMQSGSDTVGVFDTVTNAKVGEVPVPTQARDIVVDSETHTVYVGSEGPAPISVIDAASLTVTATIPFGNQVRGMAIDPKSRTLYVVGDERYTHIGESPSPQILKIVDTVSNTVRSVTTLPAADSPWAVAVDPGEQRVYLLGETSGPEGKPDARRGWVRVLNAETGAVTGSVTISTGSDVHVLADVVVDPVTHDTYALEIRKIYRLSR